MMYVKSLFSDNNITMNFSFRGKCNIKLIHAGSGHQSSAPAFSANILKW